MFKIGDLVTRNSYNNDIVFRIENIEDDNYILKGITVRLCADSPYEDLKKVDRDNDDNFVPDLNSFDKLDRDEYFYLPGKILHIDGDSDYLDKCMKFYKKNKLKAYGIHLEPTYVHSYIEEYLKKYNPDILVITGHDAYYRKKRNNLSYKNSDNFVKAIKEARKIENDHQKLFIIAGACQSNYEELIKAGANFASSPKRINIHALDPAVVAVCLAFSDKNKNIDLIKIIEKTKYGASGIGGIITKGTMYIGYPR